MDKPDFKFLGQHSFEEMNLPPIIYKYRDWTNSYNKRILTERELYLARPDSFEDEFDCKVPIRYDLLTDEDIFLKYFNSSRQDNPSYTLKQHLEFARLWQAKGLMRDKNHLEMVDKEFFKRFNEVFGVLSLTAVPDNLTMWNYYSSNQTGFCVGFHTIPLFKLSEYIGSGGEVIYYEKLPVIKETDSFDEKHFYQVFSKLEEWSFEKEYRLTKINVKNRSPKIPVEIFAEVILGAKMTDENKVEITELVKKNFPNVKLIQANETDGNITMTEIE